MAPRITGSANREKRKAQSSNRPITQGQNPQRSNRQGVSRATVSNGDSRTRTGTARVTTNDSGPPKPVTRQSRVNGRLVAGTDTRPSPNTRASASTPSKPTGPVRPSIGNVSGPASNPNRPAGPGGPVRPSIGNVSGPASSPNRPGATPKPPAKPAGNFRAPSVPPAGSGTKPPVKGTPQAEAWLKEQLKARGSNSLKGSKIGNKRTGVAGAIAEAASDQWLAPIARNAGTALAKGPLTAAGRFIDDRLPGVNSKDEAKRKDSTQTVVDSRTPKLSNSMPSRPVGTRQTLNGKSVYWDGYKWTASSGSPATASKATAPKAPKLPAASSPSSSTSGSSRSSGGSSMSSPVRTSSPKPAAPEVKQSKDMNENYKVWAAKYGKLADKVKQGQAGYEAIKGKPAPAKEAASPAKSDALKISADTAKNFRTDIALLDKKKKK